jgi:hypothetical protein
MARSRIVIIILEALIALALAFAIVFTLRTVANAEEPRKPEKQHFPVPIWECGDATVYHKQPSRLDRTSDACRLSPPLLTYSFEVTLQARKKLPCIGGIGEKLKPKGGDRECEK